MCFSAKASFIASAVLTVTGIAALKIAKPPSLRWLAAVPLLFALQQFSEGVLWLYLPDLSAWPAIIAKYIYLIFAYLAWPIWITFALWVPEREKWRRHIIGLALLGAVALASYFVSQYYTWEEEVPVGIVNQSIQYQANSYPWKAIYLIIVVTACFASSLRGMALFGLFSALSFVIVDYFYNETFISVWCFSAAIISFFIYGVIKVNRRET